MKPSLFYPCKPMAVNQAFGLNNFPFYAQQGYKGHNGIDFFATHGQPVYATHDGVCMPEIDDHGGNGVVIISNQGDYPIQFKTLYWHLIQDNAVVQTGQKVKAGDLIGYADSTGISTGDHLHFGLYFFPVDTTNGYNGATDPQPYFNGKYAQDINNPPPPVPKYVFKEVLRLKAWSNDVKQLQLALQKLNLYSGVIDGIFGNITQSSVKQFQIANKLVPDGIVGPKTNQQLNLL